MNDDQRKFCVLLADPSDFQLPLVAKALAAFKGIALHDATRLAKNSGGILGENLGIQEAQKLAVLLEDAGLHGVILDQDKLAKIPDGELLTMIELIDQDWRFHLRGSSQIDIETKQIQLIAARSYDETAQTTKQIKESPGLGRRALSIGIMMTTGLPINIGGKTRVVTKTERQTTTLYAADLFAGEPLRRFQIDAKNFNYTCLNERKGFNAFNNFRLLLIELASHSPLSQRNFGAKVITNAGPIHEMAYDSAGAYEREIRWLLTLGKRERD